jgi:hypothetical protein
MSKKLSIILRGHIRNSFKDQVIYNYIKQLSEEYDLSIFIQTWNILQTDVSWRYLEKNETPVTKEIVINYFGKLSSKIKKIIILDDKKIELIGKTTGRMGKTSGSYLGWKQMWYGIYEIADYVKTTNTMNDSFIINTRFDVFNNSVSFSLQTINEKLNSVMTSSLQPEKIMKNVFLKDVEFFGMDNFYIGNVETIFKLADRFKYYLDEIVVKYPKVTSHEFYTFHINNTLFLDNWLQEKKSVSFTPEPKTLAFSNGTRSNTKMDIILNNNGDHSLDNRDNFIIGKHDNKSDLILSDSKHNKNSMKIQLTNQQQSVNRISNSEKTLALQSTEQHAGVKMSLLERLPFLDDIELFDKVYDQPQVSILSSGSHSRTGKLSLLESNVITHEVVNIPTEANSILTLSSGSHNKTGKLSLLESKVIANDTVTIPREEPSILTLSSGSKKSDKLALLESVPNSDDVIDSNQPLLIMSSINKSKGAKLAITDYNGSSLPVMPEIIPNENSQIHVLASTIQSKNGKPLLLNSKSSEPSIDIIESPMPILTTPSVRRGYNLINSENNILDKPMESNNTFEITSNKTRSFQPLIILEPVEITPVHSSEIVLKNTKNNKTRRQNNQLDEPLPKPIQKIGKKQITRTPIPISKFSVSLDPSFLKVKEKPNTPSTITGAKLIHGDKFRINTQSLSSYYALLST